MRARQYRHTATKWQTGENIQLCSTIDVLRLCLSLACGVHTCTALLGNRTTCLIYRLDLTLPSIHIARRLDHIITVADRHRQ